MSRDQLMLRVAVVLMPAVATFATFVASSDWFVWVLPLVMAGAIACALRPESNLGLAVVIALALHWIAAVEEQTTPWVLVVALSVAVFHAATAASGVAAPTARWSRPMRVRWLRRLGVVLLTTLLAWCLQAALGATEVDGSALVLATALAVLTFVALALRAGALRQPR